PSARARRANGGSSSTRSGPARAPSPPTPRRARRRRARAPRSARAAPPDRAARRVGAVRQDGRVSITLVTGPANSGKAEVVMDAVRRHLARRQEPLLVVPTRTDVEHYLRELAGG